MRLTENSVCGRSPRHARSSVKTAAIGPFGQFGPFFGAAAN